MRPAFAALAYLAAAGALGCALAGLVHGWVEAPFEKLLSRSVILAALLLLVPFLRWLRLSSVELGFHGPMLRPLALSWGLGALLVMPLIAVFALTGYRVIDDRVVHVSLPFLWGCLGALGSGALVGLIEETVVRGFLLNALGASRDFVAAAVSSSAIYAAVHFLAGPAAPTAIDWTTGFAMAAASLAGLTGAALADWSSFLSLFLLGLALCWVRKRTGSLYACIGLHAAFVTCIRLLKNVTVRDVVNPYAWLAGEYDHFVGHLATAWLLLIALALYAFERMSARSR